MQCILVATYHQRVASAIDKPGMPAGVVEGGRRAGQGGHLKIAVNSSRKMFKLSQF